jgi:hypothetical protein
VDYSVILTILGVSIGVGLVVFERYAGKLKFTDEELMSRYLRLIKIRARRKQRGRLNE